MKFTDRGIKNLKPREKRYIAWKDGGEGLGIRVSTHGKKSFVYMYRYVGKTRMMTLGDYPRTTLAQANKKHATAQELLEKDIDPGTQEVERKQMDRKAPTVSDLCQEYLEKWAEPRKKSAHKDKQILEREVIPLWGKRKAKDITRRDVFRLLDRLVDRGSPIQANRVLALVRKMFNFAISRDLIDTTPCAQVRAPARENRRDRMLTESEIRALWCGLDKARMAEGTRLALKLQLLTAQRKGEVVTAEWCEFDLENGWWTITGEKSKNKLPHRVPLSSQTMEMIGQIKAISGDSPWLFPSARGDGHLTDSAINYALRASKDLLEVDDFTPHDLRRTAASHMTGMGIPRLVVSKLLNHAESGVTAIYDRHSYDAEKRQALDAWGRKLESIISGQSGNVIEMSRA